MSKREYVAYGCMNVCNFLFRKWPTLSVHEIFIPHSNILLKSFEQYPWSSSTPSWILLSWLSHPDHYYHYHRSHPCHHQKRLRLLPMKRGIPFVLSQLLADTEHSKQYQRHHHHCHHQHYLPDCSHHQGEKKRLRLVTTRWHRPLPTEKRRAGKRQKSRVIMRRRRRISTMAKRRRMMTT